MKYIIIFIIYILSSCGETDTEKFKRLCPQDFKYSANHYLKVPVQITPHQLTYSVGDTITFSTIFSDSIYDLSTEQTYLIREFPFIPSSSLYRFYNGTEWESGYRINEWIVDSIYNAKYVGSNEYGDHIKAYTLYDDGFYTFSIKVVLNKKGRYIFKMTDKYQDHDAGGSPELNEEADDITFEGKCPFSNYYICTVIEGEDHIELFENELVYLDKVVYWDNLASINRKEWPGTYGKGSIVLEWVGTFGFIVE